MRSGKFKLMIENFLYRMARVKNSVRKVGLYNNPFRKLNKHGYNLLDPEVVKQLCQGNGKNALFRIRMRSLLC